MMNWESGYPMDVMGDKQHAQALQSQMVTCGLLCITSAAPPLLIWET